MLEEKIETLTKEVVALRQAIEANGTGGGSSSTAKSGGKTGGGKAKDPEPEHDADEVGATMRKAAKKDKPAVQKYIKSVKCADLADLLTKPALFDAAFDFAQGVLDAEESEDDDV